MTDNSNIVLRWVIDDATAALTRKKAESGVFNKGGFKWIAALDNVPGNDLATLTLHCDADHNGPWKCEVKASMHMLTSNGDYDHLCRTKCNSFDEINCNWTWKDFMFWSRLGNSTFLINNKVTMEFLINIVSSDRGQSIADSAMFDAPNRMSNVILKIGDKKLHVSKEILAIHSPFFQTLFFGDFSENGKEEVVINDVVYEEFIDLLHLIYVGTMEITDRTVSHILKLSDQFQMERILAQAMKHLTQTKGIDTMKKLLIADQYRLNSLRDQWLQSFTSSTHMLEKLKLSPEFVNFSAEMKAAICIRLVEI